MTSALPKIEKPENSARHWHTDLPYRMVVFHSFGPNGTPLFVVAKSAAEPRGADKALRLAHETHGGPCFYCKQEVAHADATIDHVEATADGGSKQLQNLVIACKPCNARKGRQPIELFNRDAGREWLSAVLAQVQDRLNRL